MLFSSPYELDAGEAEMNLECLFSSSWWSNGTNIVDCDKYKARLGDWTWGDGAMWLHLNEKEAFSKVGAAFNGLIKDEQRRWKGLHAQKHRNMGKYIFDLTKEQGLGRYTHNDSNCQDRIRKGETSRFGMKKDSTSILVVLSLSGEMYQW